MAVGVVDCRGGCTVLESMVNQGESRVVGNIETYRG